jgi:hypothetical protein
MWFPLGGHPEMTNLLKYIVHASAFSLLSSRSRSVRGSFAVNVEQGTEPEHEPGTRNLEE